MAKMSPPRHGEATLPEATRGSHSGPGMLVLDGGAEQTREQIAEGESIG